MVYINHKKAYFDYEILEKFDGGLELFGYEVKSIRAGRGSLDGARIIIRGKEAYLVGVNIPPYQASNAPKDYDETRTRKLLITKKEINLLEKQSEKAGLTIVPLSVYNSKRKLKLSFALARGKKKFDKRETIKKRDTEKNIRREIKGH